MINNKKFNNCFLLKCFLYALLILNYPQCDKLKLPNKHNIFIKSIESGYTNNPEIHSALRKLYKSSERIPTAKGAFLPSISATFSHKHDANKTTSVNDITKSAGINLSQNLYNGGKDLNSLRQAETALQTETMNFVQVEQNVILNTIVAYVNLWQAYEILKLRKISEKFHTRNVDENRTQEELGEKSKNQVAEAEAKLAGAITERINAQAQVLSLQAKYLQVTSQKAPEHNNIFKPYCILEDDILPSTLQELQQTILQTSPNLKASQYSEKSALLGINIAEGEFFPKIALTLSRNRQHREVTLRQPKIFSTNNSVGLEINVPIFQKGQEWSKLRAAHQERLQISNDLRKTRLEIEQTATTQWYEWHASTRSVTQMQKQVSAAWLNLEGKKNEYLVGESPLTFVLEAEQGWVNAKVNEIGIYRSYILRYYQLLSVCGKLLPQYLKIPIKRYNVEEYTKSVKNKFFGLGNSKKLYNMETR